MLEDKLLVLKCRRGSRDAMCRVYEKYKDYLLTLAKGLLGEQAEAEDVVHDVFVAFARSVGRFQLTGSLRGYLAICVTNLARDKMRAQKRRYETLGSAESVVSVPNDPQQHAAEREELTRLSCQHAELGQKIIDGVSCEGLETRDAAVFGALPGPVDRLDVHFRLWVDAETQYPVLFEWKVNAEAEGQAVASEAILDQFQWDVELDPGIFEPNIPPDYMSMRDL